MVNNELGEYQVKDVQSLIRNRDMWIVVSVLLLSTTTVFAILFSVYYADSDKSTSHHCSLTYDASGVIHEWQMQRWAADAQWTITTPQWHVDKQACVCDDDSDPSNPQFNGKKTPVWIAPVDLYSLYPEVNFPIDFPAMASNPEDHVKVCLERTKLNQLWFGLNATGAVSGSKHCHQEDPFQLYTGWDGDLYCESTELPYCIKKGRTAGFFVGGWDRTYTCIFQMSQVNGVYPDKDAIFDIKNLLVKCRTPSFFAQYSESFSKYHSGVIFQCSNIPEKSDCDDTFKKGKSCYPKTSDDTFYTKSNKVPTEKRAEFENYCTEDSGTFKQHSVRTSFVSPPSYYVLQSQPVPLHITWFKCN